MHLCGLIAFSSRRHRHSRHNILSTPRVCLACPGDNTAVMGRDQPVRCCCSIVRLRKAREAFRPDAEIPWCRRMRAKSSSNQSREVTLWCFRASPAVLTAHMMAEKAVNFRDRWRTLRNPSKSSVLKILWLLGSERLPAIYMLSRREPNGRLSILYSTAPFPRSTNRSSWQATRPISPNTPCRRHQTRWRRHSPHQWCPQASSSRPSRPAAVPPRRRRCGRRGRPTPPRHPAAPWWARRPRCGSRRRTQCGPGTPPRRRRAGRLARRRPCRRRRARRRWSDRLASPGRGRGWAAALLRLGRWCRSLGGFEWDLKSGYESSRCRGWDNITDGDGDGGASVRRCLRGSGGGWSGRTCPVHPAAGGGKGLVCMPKERSGICKIALGIFSARTVQYSYSSNSVQAGLPDLVKLVSGKSS